MKIIFFIALLIEVFLSHQGGEESGAESRALAKSLHIPEKVLRISAHVILFAVLSGLCIISFPGLPLPLRIGVIGGWAVVDEYTKSWSIFKGRHFSWQDVGWNVVGTVIGTVAGIVVTLAEF